MSAAKAQDQCASYVGTTIAPISFDSATSKFGKLQPKGEFETTVQYEARKAAALQGSTGALIISKAPEDRKYIEYNADTQKLRVLSYAFHNSNFDPWTAFYSAKIDKSVLDANTSGNYDVVISQTDLPTGTYTGTNSFGAKTRIVKVTRTTKAIFDRKAPSILNDYLFPAAAKEPVVGEFSLPPAEAAVLKKTMKLAFVVVPKEPYLVRSTSSRGRPTIQNPRDITENFSILIADIQCGLATDASNKVIGAYPTN